MIPGALCTALAMPMGILYKFEVETTGYKMMACISFVPS